MNVTGDWLHRPATRAVCDMLIDGGHHALFVGGCVRNALLGMPVTDVDIATEAPPERVRDLAVGAGFKAVPTGAEHGTMTVVADDVAHEITTFRRDVETDGRRAVIAYSDSVEEDAARRDFTMNALYATPEGTVVDPLGRGLADLRQRRLRFVGEPRDRIREDFLRILRFFRFHAWYGDPDRGPDPDGLAACAELARGIEVLSRERLGTEMRKLLAAPDPAPSVATMAHAGVLAHVLPGAEPRALPLLVHAEQSAGVAPDWLRRLASLAGPEASEALRLSRKQARRLETLRDAVGTPDAPATLAYRHGAQAACDVVLLRAALLEAPPPPDWQQAIARGAAAEFPVRAADLMPDYTGPALGRRLAELEEAWIASGFTLTRAQLLA